MVRPIREVIGSVMHDICDLSLRVLPDLDVVVEMFLYLSELIEEGIKGDVSWFLYSLPPIQS